MSAISFRIIILVVLFYKTKTNDYDLEKQISDSIQYFTDINILIVKALISDEHFKVFMNKLNNVNIYKDSFITSDFVILNSNLEKNSEYTRQIPQCIMTYAVTMMKIVYKQKS